MDNLLCRLSAALSAAVFLTGCGGADKSRTNGKRSEADPITTSRPGHAQPEAAKRGSKPPLTPAEAQKLLKREIQFTRAHCPCTYEQTSNGARLLSERHP
jgi:hypothetical protein